MKLLFKKTLEKVQSFLYGQDEPTPIQNNSLATTIQQAIQKKTAVHIIFSETSFTGDIIKYDTERQQLIVKNFAKNITRIIRISDIRIIRVIFLAKFLTISCWRSVSYLIISPVKLVSEKII